MRLVLLISCILLAPLGSEAAQRSSQHQPKADRPSPNAATEAHGSTLRPTSGRAAAVYQQNHAAAAATERRIKAMQMQLVREEKMLRIRLDQINKMREAAIRSRNDKQLKHTEQLQRNVVKQYEQKVERLVIGAAPQGKPKAETPKQSPQRKSPQPRKSRFRGWPFGR